MLRLEPPTDRQPASLTSSAPAAQRNTSGGQDRYYDHPDTALFPNFGEWFDLLRAKGLRTYFNDHPFPVASRNAGGLQTSKEEAGLRHAAACTRHLHAVLRTGATRYVHGVCYSVCAGGVPL